jgi:hypothetical protein
MAISAERRWDRDVQVDAEQNVRRPTSIHRAKIWKVPAICPLIRPNVEPGKRVELISPDYKAGALPLSYPGGSHNLVS